MSWFDQSVQATGGYGPALTAAPTSSYYTPTGRVAPETDPVKAIMKKLSAFGGKSVDDDPVEPPKAMQLEILKALAGTPLQKFGNFAMGGLARDALASYAGMAALVPGAMEGQATGMPQAGGMSQMLQMPQMGPKLYPTPLKAAVGMYVGGDMGHGTSDDIDAKLSVGEYVIPADVVSGMGQGSSEAGAKYFDDLVAQVRQMHMRNMSSMPPPR